MIYGTRAKHLGSFQVKEIPCPYCEHTGDQNMSIFGRYAHVMWIPLFPIGKTPIAECVRCKRTYDSTEFSDKMHHIGSELGGRVKPPTWMWAGLILIAGVLVLGVVFSAIADRLPKDPRDEMLNQDIGAMMAEPMAEFDSTALTIDNMLTMFVVEELQPETFTYLTKVRGDNALILVTIPNLELLENSARPEIMQTVEMIVASQEALNDKNKYYGIMGAEARFMLVKTPIDSSYSTYANKDLLYEFYGPGPVKE
ncbi:hypothetical protein [Neolewinella persica]|uniref:hypothetical protein n=1 Tax=Neolewinella persica TaxID=70998 RepID=UPI0003815D10|nr:hypothetical protein [Neolewinella persica]